MSNNIRIERDLLGTREVPADAYYGVHTLRTTKNSYISSNKISGIPEFIRGVVVVRKAAAIVSRELQAIPESVANAIVAACDEALNSGKCMDQFLVDVYQGDADTSVNMNANEMLTNIGLKPMSHQKDRYQYLNPNDHANKCQSTNDVYPTGSRIMVYSSLIKLVDTINQLREGLERKAIEFQDILKMGRTQLQDVVPMALGQEFRAFSILPEEEVENVQRTTGLLLEVNLGTTTIGTGLNAPKEYFPLAMKKLAEVTGLPCVPAKDLVEAASDYGAYVMVHGAPKRLAAKISKIYNGLYLLSSGPCAGLNEVNLPGLQTDSSIVPAKVNPVVPEVVSQVCFKVISNDATVTVATEASQLQLNVIEPVIGQAMFESVHVLTNACYNLLEKYINGITTNREACRGYAYNSIGIAAYLSPFIGRHNDDIVDKVCAETGRSVREVVLERGLLTEAELDDIFSVQNLMHPAYKAKRYTDESEQ